MITQGAIILSLFVFGGEICVRWRTFRCLHAGERALVRRGLVCYRRPVTVKPARAGQIWGTSAPEH
jgi:hypothetical protein